MALPFAAGSELLASGFLVYQVFLFEWEQYVRGGCVCHCVVCTRGSLSH